MTGNSHYRPHRLGQQAETAARDYLLDHGLQLVTRNFRCRRGEIDLIMHEGDTLVFVEVRYRTSEDYGGALASVDYRKQRRIIHCAEVFLHNNPGQRQRNMRLDVICVHLDGQQASCDWIRDAFQASY